jgi:hypothetical protein
MMSAKAANIANRFMVDPPSKGFNESQPTSLPAAVSSGSDGHHKKALSVGG